MQTGLVRYEWHSLDHVPLSDAYVSPLPGSLKEPFDFFHVNSIDVKHDGDLLIDARNTWAAYDVDARTGQVRWRLGGRRSSFKMGPGTGTAYQHDAREQPERQHHVLRQRRDAEGAPAVARDRSAHSTCTR